MGWAGGEAPRSCLIPDLLDPLAEDGTISHKILESNAHGEERDMVLVKRLLENMAISKRGQSDF